MKSHRIAVIGAINRDIIISNDGTHTESLGGILYNVLALAELGTDLLTVSPVTYIGSDVKTALLKMLNRRRVVSLEGITETSGNTNTNHLFYVNKNERKETAIFYTPAISFDMILPFLNHDILLFNFIAGYDVSLETLRAVRNRTDAMICIDVHSMVLKKNMNKERTFVGVENWQTWVGQTDMIQMNTKELLYFTGSADRMERADPITVRTLMRRLMRLGPRLVIITAGNRGVYLGVKQGIYFLPQRYCASVKDTTGCGDIFTASFLAKLLVSGDACIACDYANTLSGLAVREMGIKKCFSLKHSSPLCVIPPPPTSSSAPFAL